MKLISKILGIGVLITLFTMFVLAGAPGVLLEGPPVGTEYADGLVDTLAMTITNDSFNYLLNIYLAL